MIAAVNGPAVGVGITLALPMDIRIDLATSGHPTEAAYVATYCARTGRSHVEHWTFYLACSLFRLAAARAAATPAITVSDAPA